MCFHLAIGPKVRSIGSLTMIKSIDTFVFCFHFRIPFWNGLEITEGTTSIQNLTLTHIMQNGASFLPTLDGCWWKNILTSSKRAKVLTSVTSMLTRLWDFKPSKFKINPSTKIVLWQTYSFCPNWKLSLTERKLLIYLNTRHTWLWVMFFDILYFLMET